MIYFDSIVTCFTDNSTQKNLIFDGQSRSTLLAKTERLLPVINIIETGVRPALALMAIYMFQVCLVAVEID